MPRNNCYSCNGIGSTSAPLIQCHTCKKSFHRACVNLNENDVAFLAEGLRRWSCPPCTSGQRLLRSGAQSLSQPEPMRSDDVVRSGDTSLTVNHFELLMEQMRILTTSMERIEKRQDDLLLQLSNCTDAIGEHSALLIEHKSAIESCEAEIRQIRSDQTALSDGFSSVTNRICHLESSLHGSGSQAGAAVAPTPEILDRVRRSFNLILTNVPESAGECEDRNTASSIIDHIHRSSSLSLQSVLRLRSKDASRPRWMKLTFSNPEIVSSILRNRSSLRGHRSFRDIMIQDDKTRSQVVTLNALRRELKDRQKLGEEDITIKYVDRIPRIVKLPPQLSQPKN